MDFVSIQPSQGSVCVIVNNINKVLQIKPLLFKIIFLINRAIKPLYNSRVLSLSCCCEPNPPFEGDYFLPETRGTGNLSPEDEVITATDSKSPIVTEDRTNPVSGLMG